MSKTLWHTIKLEVPKEMVNITKNDKVVVKKTLTKTNNISKANKEPSIKIIPGDTNKPKIISDGKEWNIEELKLKMKKSNELGKKNEGKEYKKKTENKILKSYTKKVTEKIVEKKKKEQKFTPITSVADFRNQLRNAIKKDKSHINKVKSIINTEQKQENKPKQTNISVTAPPTNNNNKLSDEQIIINEWTTPLNYIIFQQYDMKAYENIENTIIKENKLNHHIFTPNLLVFTKKYNDKIIKKYGIMKDYKDGMDRLYKGLYNIIENIIDSNELKMKPGSPVDVFKDRKDYNIGLKYINKALAYKIYSNKETESYI